MKTLFRLMFEFFKTGLFAVGGGLATLPFIYDMADKSGWFTHLDISNMIAISESTPGAMGINMSTYVGYLVDGIPGALLATLALVTPSVIIIIIIAKGMECFKNSKTVECIFKGLRPASTALIAAAGLRVAKLAFFPNGVTMEGFSLLAVGIALGLYVLIRKYKLHPLACIALSAFVGCLLQM